VEHLASMWKVPPATCQIDLSVRIDQNSSDMHLSVPPSRSDITASLHKEATIISMKYSDDGVAEIIAKVPEEFQNKYKPFLH